MGRDGRLTRVLQDLKVPEAEIPALVRACNVFESAGDLFSDVIYDFESADEPLDYEGWLAIEKGFDEVIRGLIKAKVAFITRWLQQAEAEGKG